MEALETVKVEAGEVGFDGGVTCVHHVDFGSLYDLLCVWYISGFMSGYLSLLSFFLSFLL